MTGEPWKFSDLRDVNGELHIADYWIDEQRRQETAMTDQATERAARDSWGTYRKVLGGPLTVSWDDLPAHQRERWLLIVADARKGGRGAKADDD